MKKVPTDVDLGGGELSLVHIQHRRPAELLKWDVYFNPKFNNNYEILTIFDFVTLKVIIARHFLSVNACGADGIKYYEHSKTPLCLDFFNYYF